MEYEVGQKWLVEKVTPWSERPQELKIMAIADKHIMCRYSRCIPFVKSIKEFPKFLEKMEAKPILTTKNK